MNKTGKQSFISILLTLIVISLFIAPNLSSAVTVNVNTDKEFYHAADTEVVFTTSIDIESGERIPIQDLVLKIDSVEVCKFDIDGSIISGCTDMTITAVNDIDYNEGDRTATGVGYDSGNNWVDETTGFGYGFGYVDTGVTGELTYEIKWDITSQGEGDYIANLEANAVDGTTFRYSQTPTTFGIWHLPPDTEPVIEPVCVVRGSGSPDSKPTAQLILKDETSDSIKTIVVAEDDLANAGVQLIKIYRDNELVAYKNCHSTATCIFSKIIYERGRGTNDYHAKVYDNRCQETLTEIITK